MTTRSASDEPLVSVVVPTHNRERAVLRAIRSVLGQSHSNVEVIVVDDGSTDGTREAVKALGNQKIVFIAQENEGGAAARNKGIAAANGTYVALLDSDDEFLPNHLKRSIELLAKWPTNTVAYGQIIVQREGGNSFLKPPRAIGEQEHVSDYLMCDRGFIQTSTIVMSAHTAKAVNYRKGLPFGQDTDYAIRLAANGCVFKMDAEPTVIWNDFFDPDRVSAYRKGHLVSDWLEEIRPNITPKAYLGYRGWHVAKGVAVTNPGRALSYFFTAVFKGCYRPKLAATIFIQIILPTRWYRSLSNLSIAWIRGA